MTLMANMGEVTFELRYKQGGKKYKWTGKSRNAEITNEAEYDEVPFLEQVFKARNHTKITLDDVQEFNGISVGPVEDRKFIIDNLPNPPFNHKWEIHPVFDEYTTHHYPSRTSTHKVRNPHKWDLKIVNEEGYSVLTKSVTSLNDDTLRNTARNMIEEYVARNRARALEEGPVRLIGDDDR